MAYEDQSEGSKALDQREHNRDAVAKRVIMRYQDPDNGNWYNFVPDKVAGVDYDYLSAVNTAANTDKLTLKIGGSGGTTVQTLVITYPASVSKVSDNITTVSWS